MADYDENNKGTLSREHFRKKLAGLVFPLTFNSKRKAMLSAIYTIRAEEPNSVIVSASTATQEYRFLVKSLNHESHTDPEAYPDSDAMGRSIPIEEFKLTASLDLIKVRTIIKYYTQEPEDNFSLSASLVAVKIRTVLKNYAQPQEDTFTLTASLDIIKLWSVVVFHAQPMEDVFNLTSSLEQVRSVKIFNDHLDSTERYASSSAVTITVPTLAREGDTLIAVLVTAANTPVTSPDWDEVFSATPSNTVRIFTREWDGEATSYTFTLVSSSKWSVYCYVAEEYINQDYTLQNIRNYLPSTGNELRVIGYDDGFDITTYASNDISLVTPLDGKRTGFPKYLANNTTKTLDLAGTVTKLPITSLDPIEVEVEYPNQNITKQFMVILETRKKELMFPPVNVRARYVVPEVEE